MTRLLKRRNLFALLFAVLLAFPMLSILARTIYVSANKNAKDSYGGVSSVTTSVNFTQSNNFEDANLLFVPSKKTSGSNGFVGVKQVSWYNGTAEYNAVRFDFEKVYVLNYDFDNNTVITTVSSIWKTDLTDSSLSAISNGLSYTGGYTAGFTGVYLLVSALNNKLDNAFEYSVNQFIQDNNFGKLDFFQWFNNMFLDSNNSVNNMYVHFVNWYLNYALLISLAYILFLVLMWFINYVRKLLEKGMDFGEGSY